MEMTASLAAGGAQGTAQGSGKCPWNGDGVQSSA